ncbi:ABC transporter substrate-binding protein [Sphaerisporangium perillae]|uniref:ABC transporter substrate-binding protein n=1 Tax=Sphaerisporangium perillae TaxID=2935860 RepID=UPI002010C4ED|nr:ABC transporter substrate-binding protein [Sphaerisporangium perillae]
MRLRSTHLFITCVAALALATSACGGGGSNAAGDKEIKIGAWYPLTGPVAASGVPQRAGADAYFKMTNDKGGINGRKVNWIVKDNAFDPQQTVQVARELIGQEKVVAIVAANGTAQGEATFPFALQQSKVPIFNELGGAATWYTPPRPGLFGVQTLYEDQAAALAAWAAEDGAKKVLVVHSDPAAFVNVANQVAPVLQKTSPGSNAELLSVKFQSTDYSPVITQVKAKKPDAVVLILASPEAAAYLKEAKLQGLSVPTYGYAPTAAASTLTLAGDAAEGFKAVQLVKVPNDSDPSVKEFRDAMAKYEPGQPADFIALWGWTAAKVFVQIAQTVQGPVTSQSLVAAYEKAGQIDPGVAPVMSFSAGNHLGTRAVQKVIVKDGQFVSEGDFYTPPDR